MIDPNIYLDNPINFLTNESHQPPRMSQPEQLTMTTNAGSLENNLYVCVGIMQQHWGGEQWEIHHIPTHSQPSPDAGFIYRFTPIL